MMESLGLGVGSAQASSAGRGPNCGTVLSRTRAFRRATVVGMDEARAVIDRLERIGKLERSHAPPEVLLEELRGLVREAEVWARAEGDERAAAAVDRCDAALAQPVA
jgi:hypothetical protein